MEDWTGGLCSVTAGIIPSCIDSGFFNVYEFQCSNSGIHLRFGTRPSPLGTLTPETSASRATLHLPLATFS